MVLIICLIMKKYKHTVYQNCGKHKKKKKLVQILKNKNILYVLTEQHFVLYIPNDFQTKFPFNLIQET